jgi:hypothetical protein
MEDLTMARDGQKILDSDMHVFEPHDLYLKYMNPKWGDRIPRGEPRQRRKKTRPVFGRFYVRQTSQQNGHARLQRDRRHQPAAP